VKSFWYSIRSSAVVFGSIAIFCFLWVVLRASDGMQPP
jgi:hypothetical protein